MLPTKFQFIWLSGFRAKDQNVTTDDGRQVYGKSSHCLWQGEP